MNPTLLGAGPSLFSGLSERARLERLSATADRSGNVSLRYRPGPS